MADEGFFWGKDGGKYRTIFERDAADTRYEQQEAIKQQLQEQNELARQQQQMEQQRIQADKENAQIKAKAIRQAEEDKFLYQAYLQIKQQNFEEEQRKIRLCDDLGVDYEEIVLFISNLEIGDKEILEKIDNLNKTIEYKEKSLREYRNNKPNRSRVTKSFEDKIRSLHSEINSIKNSKSISVVRITINIFAVFFIIMFAFNCLAGIDNAVTILLCTVGGTVGFNLLWSLMIKAGKNTQINKLKTQIKNIENSKKKAINEYSKTEEKKLLEYNERVSNCQKDLDEASKEKEELEKQNKQLLLDKYNKFMEFRTTHYNDEMEMLLKKLKFEYLKEMDFVFEQSNPPIEECASQTGTIKDYIQYMRKAIK